MLGYLAAFCVSSESPSSFTSSSKLTISSRSGTNLKTYCLLGLCSTISTEVSTIIYNLVNLVFWAQTTYLKLYHICHTILIQPLLHTHYLYFCFYRLPSPLQHLLPLITVSLLLFARKPSVSLYVKVTVLMTLYKHRQSSIQKEVSNKCFFQVS